jgi:hypothetical protein
MRRSFKKGSSFEVECIKLGTYLEACMAASCANKLCASWPQLSSSSGEGEETIGVNQTESQLTLNERSDSPSAVECNWVGLDQQQTQMWQSFTAVKVPGCWDDPNLRLIQVAKSPCQTGKWCLNQTEEIRDTRTHVKMQGTEKLLRGWDATAA